MRVLIDILIEKQLSISSCESFTAGLFAYELGKVPGVSAVYRGSVVAYQSEIKHKVLGIDLKLLEKYGVVSSETAEQMALVGQEMFGSDVCISFTGNAGPDVLEEKACGLWFACVRIQNRQYDYAFQSEMDRNELQMYAVQLMSEKLVELIRDMPN